MKIAKRDEWVNGQELLATVIDGFSEGQPSDHIQCDVEGSKALCIVLDVGYAHVQDVPDGAKGATVWTNGSNIFGIFRSAKASPIETFRI